MMLNRDEYEDFNEDDVFYAELRRQVLLLTADEDEDYFLERKHSAGQGGGGAHGLRSFSPALQPGSYFNWWESESNANTVVPTWLVNLWRHGNGTGVFIPPIVNSRRNNKPGRTRNDRRKAFRQVGAGPNIDNLNIGLKWNGHRK